MPAPRVTSVQPTRAIEGGRVTLHGENFPPVASGVPDVRVAGQPARVVFASPTQISILIPPGITDGGRVPIRISGIVGETAFIDVGPVFATGLHQVDNPVFDAQGNLFVTYSGTRGQQVPVSIFKVRPNGTRETFSSGIVNPTSMAIDPDGAIYVSSRFEGTVYRLAEDGSAEPFATDLGIACGLTFAQDGTLFVGDRSGTIFTVDRSGHTARLASLPTSVAAFHLALGPDHALYVTGPTLSPYDPVYRIDLAGAVTVYSTGFGRPQGLAFDASGTLFVIEALAGASGLYRVAAGAKPELVLAGPGLIGVAFDRSGAIVVCSNDTAFRLAR